MSNIKVYIMKILQRIIMVLLANFAIDMLVWAQDPNYMDFNYGQHVQDTDWVDAIQIISPLCRSEVQGKVEVQFKAKGMKTAKALCWSQPTEKNKSNWGYDANLTPRGLKLKKDGSGRFTFDAELFPAGPMNIRIYAQAENGKKDILSYSFIIREGFLGNKEFLKKIHRQQRD